MDADPRLAAAVALSKRAGRMIAEVAYRHGATKLDTISDLSRILRVPGTHNVKHGGSIEVTVVGYPEGATPVSLQTIRDACDSMNVHEYDEDRTVHGEVFSDRMEWPVASTTCSYAKAMVAGPGRSKARTARTTMHCHLSAMVNLSK